MSGSQFTAPGTISLSPLSLAERRDTRGKWPLAKNQNNSWWHRHTSLKLFWSQPMTPWKTGHNIGMKLSKRKTDISGIVTSIIKIGDKGRFRMKIIMVCIDHLI